MRRLVKELVMQPRLRLAMAIVGRGDDFLDECFDLNLKGKIEP